MLIGNREIADSLIGQLIKDIKQKKELNNLADSFIQDKIKKYLSQNPAKITFLHQQFSPKSAKYKQIIKEVRKELRQVTGLFKIQTQISERKKYWEELQKTLPSSKRFLALHQAILQTHASSKERLDFYESLYQKIFKITGQPQSILDLGCGLNPISIIYTKLKKVKYYAYDIDQEEINLINSYFQYLKTVWPGFSGEAKILNLLVEEKLNQLPEADICFLWKMTEMLDRGNSHKKSEKIITGSPAKYIVVSFPTITMSGKPMNQPRRKWIELMCQRLRYSYEIIIERNELFYVIKKE